MLIGERLAGFASPCVHIYYMTRSCSRYLLPLPGRRPVPPLNSIHRIFALFKSDPMLCVAHGESETPILDYCLRF